MCDGGLRARVQAIASKCFGYEIAGALTLLVLLLVGMFVMVVVLWGLRSRAIKWQRMSVKDAAKGMKDAWTESKGKGLVHRVRVTYAAYIVLNERGEWAANEEREDKGESGNRILDRLGAFFDSSMGGGQPRPRPRALALMRAPLGCLLAPLAQPPLTCGPCVLAAWWYGFWGLLRVMAIGVILAAVFTPEANAGAILALATADSAILVLSRPQIEWMGFLQETYKVFPARSRSRARVYLLAAAPLSQSLVLPPLSIAPTRR